MDKRKRKNQGERERTDKSLRAEREQADRHFDERRDRSEAQADAASRESRRTTDAAVDAGRARADREGHGAGPTESIKRQRDDEDLLLRQERSRSDESLERERAEGRRYLAAFLLVEREATDEALAGERSRADELDHQRSELLAMVSHDLRNMLLTLALYPASLAHGLSEGESGDAARRQLAAIQRSIAQMNRLIGDLLDISMIEEGHLQLVHETLDVAAIVRDALEALEPLVREKDLGLVVRGVEAPIVGEVDGGRLMQVVANIVGNAVKFTPAGGKIEVAVQFSQGLLDISVRDDGPGIPEEALPGVFTPYRQVAPDRRGVGLGLHICKSIVEAHGGTIRVESEVGVGTVFRITLPLEPPPDRAPPAVTRT